MQKWGKNPQKFKAVAELLIGGQLLSERYKNHKLVGSYAGRYECHIEPDGLLVYKLTPREIVFERTGTHADLFN